MKLNLILIIALAATTLLISAENCLIWERQKELSSKIDKVIKQDSLILLHSVNLERNCLTLFTFDLNKNAQAKLDEQGYVYEPIFENYDVSTGSTRSQHEASAYIPNERDYTTESDQSIEWEITEED